MSPIKQLGVLNRGRCLRLLCYGLVIVTTCLMDMTRATNCPPILITTTEEDWSCWPECQEGKYCDNGRCNLCSLCPDPYTSAEQGETVFHIIDGCINRGSCPEACAPTNSMPKGNISLCDCIDVTPPPPAVPPTIACKDGCSHGGCINAGECSCDDSWTGELCDVCVPSPQCSNGYCNDTNKCICHTDWDGFNCDQDVSYCAMNQPCLNDGLCVNDGSGGYACDCGDGFVGTNCQNETSLHLCQKNCSVNATCIQMQSDDDYKCQCQDGFIGDGCVQLKTSPFDVRIAAVTSSVVIIVIAGIIIKVICRKLSWKQGSAKNESNVNLISRPIQYHLEGTTVIFKIQQGWMPCELRTCKCLLESPLSIPVGHESDVRVDGLRKGFKYIFEIYRITPSDVENSDSSLAECDVFFEGQGIGGSSSGCEEGSCTKTIGNVLQDVTLRKPLNGIIETDPSLRERVAEFFEFNSDLRRRFTARQTGTVLHIEILYEIIASYAKLDKTIEALLKSLVKNPLSDSSGEFVEMLVKFHPTCQICPRLWHHAHGGSTIWSTQACNGVATVQV